MIWSTFAFCREELSVVESVFVIFVCCVQVFEQQNWLSL